MLKKILSHKPDIKNPIIRNVCVIIGIVLGLVALGLLSGIINAILGFLLRLGWKIIIAIAVTALLCGAIFGYAEMKSNGRVIVIDDDDVVEEDDDDDTL